LEFGGLKVGSASLVDLPRLHLQWYVWTMQGGPKPPFLQKNVAYYVMGAEEWRYTDTLEAITSRSDPLYLQSGGNPTDVFRSGWLAVELPAGSEPDHYVYDPRDVSLAELESTVDPESRVEQRMLYASVGKRLVYHSELFAQETEISGFFRLSVWLSIDQPDTDFGVSVYEVGIDGSLSDHRVPAAADRKIRGHQHQIG
jgi:putative CocE/NonD family hydrolase